MIRLAFLLVITLLAAQPLPTALAQENFGVDPTLGSEISSLEGLNGGPVRQVGVVETPDGSRDTFIVDELIIRPRSDQELNELLSRYRGQVIQTSEPRLIEGEEPRPDLTIETDWLLIRIDPQTSPLDDLVENLRAAGIDGRVMFSTEAAARLIALALREGDKQLGPNFVARLQQTVVVPEHPTLGGGNLNAAEWWYMTEDDDPATSGVQGLSIGVIRAWYYLRYQGYPPMGQPYVPVKVAIIDAGFDLDQTTGMPLNGNQDYVKTPPDQIDEADGDYRVGGINSDPQKPWHGQKVFGVCCSFARNSWGSAGIVDGKEIQLLLIRTSFDHWNIRRSIMDALFNNADVINLSLGGSCASICGVWYGGGWSFNVISSAVGSARNVGAAVISAAGNESQNISASSYMPCELDGSICVGAIGRDGRARSYSNWGNVVDIWAPDGTRSTVTRDSADTDADNLGLDELAFCSGTSCAAPFVTGVVAMMKMLDSNLHVYTVESILKTTALPGGGPQVTPGYINALAALQAVRPNQPPTVTITTPVAGAVLPQENAWLTAMVTDPETPKPADIHLFPTTLTITSDRDGHLCTVTDVLEKKGCMAAQLSLGAHIITATATDAFGASASVSVSATVNNKPPIAKITYPPNGSGFFIGQQINLRGYGYDPESDAPLTLTWTSDIAGALGNGDDIWVQLPFGNHTITIRATDQFEAWDTDSIFLTMQEDPGYPTAKILAPNNGTIFTPGDTIHFVGEGIDPQDGRLQGARLRWSSDVDGDFGEGEVLAERLSGDECGMLNHRVSLRATDSVGLESHHMVVVSVGRVC